MAEDVKSRDSTQGTGSQASGQQGQTQRSGAQGSALQGSSREGGQQQGRAMQQRGGGGMSRRAQHPFAMMQQLTDEMDRLFNSFFYGVPMRSVRAADMPAMWSPEVEITTQGNELRVCVDLPGVPKDDVKVDMSDGMLTIQGERREERSEGGEQQGFHRTERRYGSFYRSIALPEGVNLEQAKAQMKDGVLEITIPMPEQSKQRSLQIEG